MKKLNLFLGTICLVFILACGGGGGSTPVTTINLLGRVINVSTGQGLKGATLQVGTNTFTITATDGSFSFPIQSTGGTLIVNSGVSTITGWSFTVPASSTDVDLGDLYVGPSRVTMVGSTKDSTNGNAVASATIKFAGQNATSAADGSFTLNNVAFDPANTATFGNIQGTANANNYFQSTFTATGATVSGSTVTLNTILMIPQGSSAPPGTPNDLFGNITPSALANGTVVSVYSGSALVRQTTVGVSGSYGFWVPPGTYKVTFANGTHTAPDANVTLADGQTLRQDATLN